MMVEEFNLLAMAVGHTPSSKAVLHVWRCGLRQRTQGCGARMSGVVTRMHRDSLCF